MITEQPAAAGTFGLSHDAWGRLVMIDSDGRGTWASSRCGPFRFRIRSIGSRSATAKGRELACVDDLAELPASVRQVLEEDLARREFVPVLERIYDVSTETAPSEWDVQTDRGRTRFMLNSEDDIRRLGAMRALIIDVQRHPLLDQRPAQFRRRQPQDPRAVFIRQRWLCLAAQLSFRVALLRPAMAVRLVEGCNVTPSPGAGYSDTVPCCLFGNARAAV